MPCQLQTLNFKVLACVEMKDMLSGKFQKLRQVDAKKDEDCVPVGTSARLLQLQRETSQNFKFQSYGSNHIIEPFNGYDSIKSHPVTSTAYTPLQMGEDDCDEP